jgi:hypothetical protein
MDGSGPSRRLRVRSGGARVAALSATLALVVACQFGSRAASPSPGAATSASPVATASATVPASPLGGDGCGEVVLFVDSVAYTTATLAGYGWDFVVGEVTGIEAAVFNTSDGKAPPGFNTVPTSASRYPHAWIYTPVDVLIDQPISGPFKTGANRFLIAGGTVGCYTVRVSPTPVVEVGSRYVFILATAPDATGKSLLAQRDARFAWPVDGEGIVATVDGPRTIAELTTIVVNSSPPSASPQMASPVPQE